MKVDNNLEKLYKAMYGEEFNRTLLTGSTKKGFSTFSIHNIDELKTIVNKTTLDDEIYISFYDFDTDEDVTRWMKTDLNKFISSAIKNSLVIRFRENSEIIKEEVRELNDIQKFMFIRRTINLGFNENIVNECKKTYDYILEKLNIKGYSVFNGINECSLYLFFDEYEFDNPTETLYYFYTFLEKTLDLKTITFAEIEPFSQIITLIGSQDMDSKLYVKPYDINSEYEEIIKNSTDKTTNYILPDKTQDTKKINKLLKTIDSEITNTKSQGKSLLEIDIDKI
ncbi:MAG: hypothetical protein BZ137_07610 [Methanosphaera sp. rholeuAM130]|nr:MAG: hypothetical protein BZ137_07610 [Methanosphaera sp. rholeuAM130]